MMWLRCTRSVWVKCGHMCSGTFFDPEIVFCLSALCPLSSLSSSFILMVVVLVAPCVSTCNISLV